MSEWEDYYEILQVSSTAEPEVIEAAFRKLARKYHPDVNKKLTAEERMKKLNIAYEVLSDPQKRRDYHALWLNRQAKPKETSFPKPKPGVKPALIFFDKVEPRKIKRASFVIRNIGGPYSKIWFSTPDSWVRVTNWASVDPSQNEELPLRVEIEAKGEDWGKSYLEYIKIRLDEEETQVRVELQTKPEPIVGTTSNLKSTYVPPYTYSPPSPSTPSTPNSSTSSPSSYDFRGIRVTMIMIMAAVVIGIGILSDISRRFNSPTSVAPEQIANHKVVYTPPARSEYVPLTNPENIRLVRYENANLGISFQYPDNMVTTSDGKSTVLRVYLKTDQEKNMGPFIFINYGTQDPKVSIEQWYNEIFRQFPNAPIENKGYSRRNVGGQSAIVTVDQVVIVKSPDGKKSFHFALSGIDKERIELLRPGFNQILDSFSFIKRKGPEEEIANLKLSSAKSLEPFFTFGSTIEEVKKVQGEPTQPTMWYRNADTTYLSYGEDGSAKVWFFRGKVDSWTSYPRSPLKARIVPSGPVDENPKFFTVGSTMDEVLFVQGQPFSIGNTSILTGTLLRTDAEVKSGAPTIKTSWIYGFASEVFFRDGKVTHWKQDGENTHWDSTGIVVLKARIVPEKPVDSNLNYFTIGSTRDEVLAIQGQPDNPFGVDWEYGKSKVYFSADLVILGSTSSKDRITQWRSDPQNPLKARIVPSGPVDETIQSFTVGSTTDEVLFLQGQPDSIRPYAGSDTWTYGPSSVNFKDGRVVSWDSYPYHAPLKAKSIKKVPSPAKFGSNPNEAGFFIPIK